MHTLYKIQYLYHRRKPWLKCTYTLHSPDTAEMYVPLPGHGWNVHVRSSGTAEMYDPLPGHDWNVRSSPRGKKRTFQPLLVTMYLYSSSMMIHVRDIGYNFFYRICEIICKYSNIANPPKYSPKTTFIFALFTSLYLIKSWKNSTPKLNPSKNVISLMQFMY